MVRILIGLLAAVCSGCSSVPADVRLGVDGRANATPSIAARGSLTAVVWGATASSGTTDVYAAVSRDGGRTFPAPVRVNDRDGDAAVGGEQPPQVVAIDRGDADPEIVVVWTAKREGGTRLLQARSTDGGRSFSPAAVMAGTDAPGNRGWQTVGAAADGHVTAVWLDHRDTAAAPAAGGAAHNHGEHAATAATPAAVSDGVARAQLSKIYAGPVDGSSPPHVLTGGVCYCCKTAVAVAGNAVFVAWRHVYQGNIRDIAVAASRDGGKSFSQPSRVSEDGWVLNGCPENGPTMAVDDAGRLHVAWPTLVGGPGGTGAQLALFHAVSSDGVRFSPRAALPTQDVPRHVQMVAAPGGRAVLAWDEGDSGTRSVVLAQGAVDSTGRGTFVRQVLETGTATYPVLATSGTDVVVAWTSGEADASTIRVQRVPLAD